MLATPKLLWNQPPHRLEFTCRDVHIWRVLLEPVPALDARIEDLLSPDETARANRFFFARDRQRFVLGRALLRALVGKYLHCRPAEVCFDYQEYGRPCLRERTNLNFNVSHSGDLALYAFTRGNAIGVDLERIRHDFEIEEIAEQFFSPTESRCFLSLPPETRVRAFFDCWTRKEAFLKAKGFGLSLQLNQFDVSFCPGEPASLLETRWAEDESSQWSLESIDVGSGYAAAVAIRGNEYQFHHWDGVIQPLLDVD